MLKKRLGKKGFTLVEIIVVLVILAILAAILIPSMVGWIDKANEKSAVVMGRSILLAAQTIASEEYGAGTAVSAIGAKITETELEKLVKDDSIALVGAVTVGENAQVTAFTATWNGQTIKYTGGKFTVEETTTP